MNAGHTAHLDLDAHAGQVWLGLRVMIRPFQPQKYRKSRNPAYHRRQERRKAARKDAEVSTKPGDTNAEEALDPDSMKAVEEAIVAESMKIRSTESTTGCCV